MQSRRGKRARVVGKYDVGENVFRAVAVFLKSEEIIGDLLRIKRATRGTKPYYQRPRRK